MARHLVSEPRAHDAIERLADMFLRFGSINAVAETLSGHLDEGQQRIYPNRIHGLLSGDPSRSVNTATLEAIESALDQAAAAGDAAAAAERRGRIAQALAAEMTVAPEARDAARRVAEELEVPYAVVAAAAEGVVLERPPQILTGVQEPDWSWQDEAVERSLAALRKGPARKVGLVIPTGGGKDVDLPAHPPALAGRIASAATASPFGSRTVLACGRGATRAAATTRELGHVPEAGREPLGRSGEVRDDQ